MLVLETNDDGFANVAEVLPTRQSSADQERSVYEERGVWFA